MPKTIVLQSYDKTLSCPWLERCLQTVSDWAEQNQFDYLFTGNELFDLVPEELLKKTEQQIVVATDLARLFKLQELLRQGYQTVIWCDADFLIFDPDNFVLPEMGYALGREVWIQKDNKNKLKFYRKVHNAFLMFRRDNTFLDFYTETAEKLLWEINGPIPPQFIGPKLLSALHNISLFPVLETAGMLSPMVIQDLIQGSGKALKLFIQQSPAPIAAANLCCSTIAKGELSAQDMLKAIDRLQQYGSRLFY